MARDYRDSRDQWDDDEAGGTPCAAGRKCAEADHAGNPQAGPRAFCNTDHGHIGQVIRGLPDMYLELSFKLPKADQQQESRVSGSREAPVPVDLEVQAFMRHMVLVTLSWEETVRAAADLSNPWECPVCHGDRGGPYPCQACGGSGVASSRDGAALQRACTLLAGHDHDRPGYLSTLLALAASETVRPVSGSRRLSELEPGTVIRIDSAGDAWQRREMDGTAAGLEFLALNGRARGLLGLTLQRRRVAVRCDRCDALTLTQREALAGGWEPVVRCTACPRTYIGAEFEAVMGREFEATAKAARAS